MSDAVTYRRVQHAGHYSALPNDGHDLEQWDVAGELPRSRRTGHPVAPPEVPTDATYHHGYIVGGVQYWVFARLAPMTGTCHRCEAAKAKAVHNHGGTLG